MGKIYWITVIFLLSIIAGGAYKFMVEGSSIKSTDGRLAVQLSAGEKDLVLSEMRGFLVSVQQIIKGVMDKNSTLITESAKKSGRASQAEVPGSLMGKLPLDFKKLGLDTHNKFDQLALDSESLGDKQHSLQQLDELMNNCVACHTTFRLESVSQ